MLTCGSSGAVVCVLKFVMEEKEDDDDDDKAETDSWKIVYPEFHACSDVWSGSSSVQMPHFNRVPSHERWETIGLLGSGKFNSQFCAASNFLFIGETLVRIWIPRERKVFDLGSVELSVDTPGSLRTTCHHPSDVRPSATNYSRVNDNGISSST